MTTAKPSGRKRPRPARAAVRATARPAVRPTSVGQTPPARERSVRLKSDLQIVSRAAHIPSPAQFNRWIRAALAGQAQGAIELTLRVVGPTEMRRLNREYRDKDYATNVLSFPFEAPRDVALPVRVLGDIVLCAQTVQREALAQGKDVKAHWAHLTVHGVLHLLGLDHDTTRHAAVMEGIEIATLEALGYANPYETETL